MFFQLIFLAIILASAAQAQVGLGDDAAPLYTIEEIKQQHAQLPENYTKLEPHFYKRAHNYLIKTRAFANYTLEDTIRVVEVLENWKAPEELAQKLPYYHSGYDAQDRPVWIAEAGKYNVKDLIERGQEWENNLTQYGFKAVLRIMKSMIAKDTPEKEMRGIFVLADLEGLDITQISSASTLKFLYSTIRNYADFLRLIEKGQVIGINVSTFATNFLNPLRPLFLGSFEKFDLFNSDKAKWKSAIQKALPESAIPTWYGGSKDYKPVKVYG